MLEAVQVFVDGADAVFQMCIRDSLIPMKITIDGEDNRIMLECKGDETLTFVPLRGDDSEIEYTVQACLLYTSGNGLPMIDF